MRTVTLAASFLLVFVSVASAQPPKVDPCTLVTPAEIKAAVGLEPGKMAINPKMNPAAGTLCDFEFPDAGAGGIAIRQLGPGETRDTMLAAMKKSKVECVDAPGVGVPSFFASPGYGMVQLNSFKGSTHVMIQLVVFGKAEDQMRIAADTLMRTVLPRIK